MCVARVHRNVTLGFACRFDLLQFMHLMPYYSLVPVPVCVRGMFGAGALAGVSVCTCVRVGVCVCANKFSVYNR